MDRFTLVFFAAALTVVTSPAQAALNRVWVSGHGVDSPSCGAVVSPCRQIKYALDNNIVAPSGEIDVLDPSGFAPFAITYAVSIVNDGVGTASITQGAAGQNAITITAAESDEIHLRGLSLEGLGTGNAGVVFNKGASITIINCVARHFSNAGFLVQPLAYSQPFDVRVTMTSVIASDNGLYGILLMPTSPTRVVGLIKQALASNNGLGGIVASSFKGGSAQADVIDSAAIWNGHTSIVTSDLYGGFAAYGDQAYISLSRCTAVRNTPGPVLSVQNGATATYGNNELSGVAGFRNSIQPQ